MSIEEFRKHKYLPQQWRKELATNGILQAVIEVLEEAHPTRFAVHTDIQDDLSPTKAALQLGETRGYSKVLNTLKVLAQPIFPVTTPEPTYQPEEQRH
jgi:hypothetical protein